MNLATIKEYLNSNPPSPHPLTPRVPANYVTSIEQHKICPECGHIGKVWMLIHGDEYCYWVLQCACCEWYFGLMGPGTRKVCSDDEWGSLACSACQCIASIDCSVCRSKGVELLMEEQYQ